MNSIIQPSYGPGAYSTPTKARETKPSGTQGSSFLIWRRRQASAEPARSPPVWVA